MSVAAAPEQCYTSGIVTQLSFRGAMLMQSNLGAQGGRCQSISWADGSRSLWNDLCVEPQPGTVHVDYTGPSVPNIADSAAPTGAIGNQHVLFRGLGTVSSPTSQDVIWLRITNETEYRAWNPRHNGVKRQSDGVREGHFGAINLLGPRSTAQLPTYKFWNDQFSIVQLRYSFMTEISQGAYRADSSGVYGLRPLNVGRMYMTFWDMDTGMPTFGASQVQKEAMQMGPQATSVERGMGRSPDGSMYSEILHFDNWPALLRHNGASVDPAVVSALLAAGASQWSAMDTPGEGVSDVYMGTTYGVGEDSTRA